MWCLFLLFLPYVKLLKYEQANKIGENRQKLSISSSLSLGPDFRAANYQMILLEISELSLSATHNHNRTKILFKAKFIQIYPPRAQCGFWFLSTVEMRLRNATARISSEYILTLIYTTQLFCRILMAKRDFSFWGYAA